MNLKDKIIVAMAFIPLFFLYFIVFLVLHPVDESDPDSKLGIIKPGHILIIVAVMVVLIVIARLSMLAFGIISLALLFLYVCNKICRKHDRQCQSEHEWTSLHFHSFNGGESKTLHYFAEGYGTHMRNHKVG